MKSPDSILFLGKRDDDFCSSALAFCYANFENVTAFCGSWREPLPATAKNWQGDYIISYLSRWVVPEFLIQRACKAAINFHPASPDYPGIGCCNFALYNGSSVYGATCHHMERIVDTGPIVAVRWFRMSEQDTVASLLERTYAAQFDLFLEIAELMRLGKPLPIGKEWWSRKPYTRAEFNELNQLLPGMSSQEEARRIRSCAFGPYSPKRVSELVSS